MNLEARNDLHLTSTGIGHQVRKGHVFPPEGFTRTIGKVYPPTLANPDWIHYEDHFKTTTGTTHDYKAPGGLLSHPLYNKAPGNWKVKYVEDNISQLQVKPWRRALTMGNQCSEMKDNYTGRPGVNLTTQFNAGIQPFHLKDHHREGNSKVVPSTRNQGIAAKKFYPRDRGVLTYHSDPYLTTTQKDHRAFTKLEQSRYPRKDYATYWECEGYPKAWGHGSKLNPLPPNSVPRQKGPMRDEMVFREGTTVPRLPKSLDPVPNKGMVSLMKETYTDPPERKRWELFTCDVPKPWHAPLEAPRPGETFKVPKVYSTEYQYYGSGKTITV
ncbi:predicted protein [Nematostella vectensis]|uniref:Uncharacterized protein n=1 Tax=Nematostella vectensis TaxID=45351 RepID=A7RLM0_NEMVE|nr:predicted protein [Nematostella vectensis]|eukprot:XP_001639691.1 predicted protein [Nematostella vectensis]